MINFRSYASGSSANLYTVDDGKTKLLLEMGLQIKEIKRRLDFGLSRIPFALLSHCHGDHSKAVKDIMKAGIDVYASESTFKELGVSGHRAKTIRALEQFQVGGWTILPFDAQHDAPEPLSFLIANGNDKMLFCTDSFYIRYRFKNLTLIAVECNYAPDILAENIKAGVVSREQKRRILQSHFSLENVKEFFRANDLQQVQEIHLLHLSNDNSDAARFKQEVEALTGKPTHIA